MHGKLKSYETLDDQVLSEILLSDVEHLSITEKNKSTIIPIDKKLLAISLQELDALIGMVSIKKQILELVDVVQYYHKMGKDVLQHFYLHTLLVGKIYKALGILERGHMVETDRQGLVAGYVGQSALKTTEKLDEAMGGVLFIDEAYSLLSMRSAGADFGHEVIQTLLKRMEDQRGNFFVFAAGLGSLCFCFFGAAGFSFSTFFLFSFVGHSNSGYKQKCCS